MTSSAARGLLLTMHSGITFGSARGYGLSGIESGLGACKESNLPVVLLL